MSRNDSNIDPFNAGEPELPWDDPSAREDAPRSTQNRSDDEEAGSDESPVASPVEPEGTYVAPQKEPDSYAAPEEGEGEKSSASRGRARTAKASASAKRPKPARPSKPAGDASKSSGGEQSGKKGGGCGCATMVLIVALFGTGALGSIARCSYEAFYAITGQRSDSTEASTEPSAQSTFDVGAAKEQIKQDLGNRLGKISDDPSLRQRIVAVLDRQVKEYLGYGIEDLGVDGSAFADAMLKSYSYKIGSTYVHPSSDIETTGSAYYDVSAIDGTKCVTDFTGQAQAYLQEKGIFAFGGATDLPALSGDQKAFLKGAMNEIVTSAKPDQARAFSLAYTYVNGAWTPDQNELSNDALSYFNLY